MPFFSYAEGAAMFDSTPIENMFLMEYLPVAPEEYLRVYLYARMLALHPELGGDLAGMAAALRMDEEAVYSAFAYWERQGLVRRLADRPPAYELLPVRADAMAVTNPMERDYYEFREFNAALQALFPPEKLLHPQEYNTAQDWINVMHFSQEAVLLAVESEIKNSRSKSPSPTQLFKRLDKRMLKWAERGLLSAADLERELQYDGAVKETAKAVLKRFALRREPTQDELECARRWLQEWGLDPAQVLEACEETTKSRGPTFAYLDAILKSRWEGTDPAWRELAAALKELDPANARPTDDLLAAYAARREEGFEPETVRLAAIQCHRRRKSGFADLQWMLDQWKAMGLFTHEAAGAYIRDMEQKTLPVRRVLEACGLERRPTRDDLEKYEDWRALYGDDVIGFAAQCARGTNVPMRYIDKLISQWHQAGITTVEAARAAHAQNRPATPGAAPANPALNYAQREYRDEDFGEDFFFDAVKAYGKEGEQK